MPATMAVIYMMARTAVLTRKTMTTPSSTTLHVRTTIATVRATDPTSQEHCAAPDASLPLTRCTPPRVTAHGLKLCSLTLSTPRRARERKRSSPAALLRALWQRPLLVTFQLQSHHSHFRATSLMSYLPISHPLLLLLRLACPRHLDLTLKRTRVTDPVEGRNLALVVIIVAPTQPHRPQSRRAQRLHLKAPIIRRPLPSPSLIC